MRDRYSKRDENKNMFLFDAINFYKWARSQPLPYNSFYFDTGVKLEDILNTPDDSDSFFY